MRLCNPKTCNHFDFKGVPRIPEIVHFDYIDRYIEILLENHDMPIKSLYVGYNRGEFMPRMTERVVEHVSSL